MAQEGTYECNECFSEWDEEQIGANLFCPECGGHLDKKSVFGANVVNASSRKKVTDNDITRYRMIAAGELVAAGGAGNAGLSDDQIAQLLGRIHQLLMANHGLSKKEADEVILTRIG